MVETGNKEPVGDIAIVEKEETSSTRDKGIKWADKTDGSAPKEAENE